MTKRFNLTLGFALFSVFLQSKAFAGVTPNFTNLDAAQTSAVLKTFGANFTFRPMDTASNYGKNFGVSVGIGGGVTSGTAITEATGLPVSQIPHANIILGLQLPRGFAVEVGFLPNLSLSGLSFNSWGGDLKWNVGAGLGKLLPLDVAARVMYSTTSMSYTQTVTTPAPATDTLSLSTHSFGFNVSASKSLVILEPFVGLGWMSQSGTLSNSGNIPLFNTSLTNANTYNASNSGLWAFGGLQFKLLILNITAEYDSMMGISSQSIKVGFKI
jgi:hypothetical protein